MKSSKLKIIFLFTVFCLLFSVSGYAQFEIKKYIKLTDSNATPTVPASGDLHLIPKGASGFFIQYPNGTLHNLDSAGGVGGGDVTLAGNNAFTGRNTYADLSTFIDSILLDPGIGTLTNTFIKIGDGKANTNARHLFVIGSLPTGTGDRNGGNIYVRGGDNINNGTEGNIILAHDGTTQIGRVNIGKETQPVGLLDVGTGGEFSVGFTGTVTMPTPFFLGGTSVTSTGTQLNFLNAATGTTGTASTNLVFSTSPTLTTPNIGAATGTSVALTGAITSSLASGNSLALETSGLVYDATNNRVGIGTASPSQILELTPTGDGQIVLNQAGAALSALMNFASDGASSATNPDWTMGIIYNTNYYSFATWDGTTTRSRIIIDTATNMAVGATTVGGHIYDGTAKNNLIIRNGTKPSSNSAITDVSYLYSVDAAATNGQANLYARNEADSVVRLTGNYKKTYSDFSVTTSTTLANITGLTLYVDAAGEYSFEAGLFVNADATGGHKYSIAGTATATSVVFQINSISNTTNAFVINSRVTSLGGSAGQAGATTIWTEIKGTIVVNAAGTLTVQFAENASSGTSTVLANSYFRLIQ